MRIGATHPVGQPLLVIVGGRGLNGLEREVGGEGVADKERDGRREAEKVEEDEEDGAAPVSSVHSLWHLSSSVDLSEPKARCLMHGIRRRDTCDIDLKTNSRRRLECPWQCTDVAACTRSTVEGHTARSTHEAARPRTP